MADQPSLRERALRLLARREHSKVELARRLKPHIQTGDDLEALLEDLSRRKLVSDQRYAEGRAHTLSKKYGASRVAHELRSRGVSAELVESTARTARETDLERAREIWRRKFRNPGQSREQRAKQMRFLQARGFSFDVIRAVVSGDADSDES